MPDDLPALTLAELARALAHGETSSRSIVAACLDRIDLHDRWLHAFVDVWRDEALARADAADDAAARGTIAGPTAWTTRRAQGPAPRRRPADDRRLEKLAWAHRG